METTAEAQREKSLCGSISSRVVELFSQAELRKPPVTPTVVPTS